MITDMGDPIAERSSGGFPVNQPLQALEKDHNYVKKLFEHYMNTQDQAVREQAGKQILIALEMHSSMEEATFYPRVQNIDPGLVDQCKDQHEQTDQMVHQLKGMNPSDPQCQRMFQQLRDAIVQHIEIEEHQLFPAIQKANIDMEAMGLEMQAFEANAVAAQAQATERRDVTGRRST
ncbi:hemerythrin domain-containing protein [Noviherbaspirillum massiliense]|uniref:hemerythrin domain-containing protein n=1 Tax=Noviherbaspirillum massiliense TaxID=1465823 RepID=UPI0009DA9DFE|nr:hemerythrin domain-containing protein [Noviherbaspirillum massiliense]